MSVILIFQITNLLIFENVIQIIIREGRDPLFIINNLIEISMDKRVQRKIKDFLLPYFYSIILLIIGGFVMIYLKILILSVHILYIIRSIGCSIFGVVRICKN